MLFMRVVYAVKINQTTTIHRATSSRTLGNLHVLSFSSICYKLDKPLNIAKHIFCCIYLSDFIFKFIFAPFCDFKVLAVDTQHWE